MPTAFLSSVFLFYLFLSLILPIEGSLFGSEEKGEKKKKSLAESLQIHGENNSGKY